MMRRIACLCLGAFCAALPPTAAAGAAPTFETRAFLLDLARQTETIDFVNAYVDRAAEAGFNMMFVYLKGVMRTKTFSLVPPEQSYSPEQMRQIVEHAKSKGVEVVPYLSLLGHGEPYFTYPELVPLCEERDGACRWPDLPKATFCLSKPETRAFLESYFEDIAEAFPGSNFHVGMDETWNMGFCKLCAPRREKIGFGGLYTEFVRWAHDLCARHGRRMWMWDDFYEFFPEELKNAPRDVVMCHWDYDDDVSLHGGRGKFLNRIRRDWLAEYDRLGIDVVVCSWLGADNIRALTDYAMRHRVKGAMLTQWEMGRCFWGTAMPKLYAAGRLWSDRAVAEDAAGDFLDFGIRRVFPNLADGERLAMQTLLRAPKMRPSPGIAANLGRRVDLQRHAAETLAVQTLGRSAYAAGRGETPADQLSPDGLVNDIMTEWSLRSAVPVFRRATQLLTDPKRTAADSKSAKKAVAELRKVLVKAVASRREQERLWRPGCWPNEQAAKADELVAYCDELLSTPDAAAKDEWRLELGLHLPDFHGLPRWTIEARFGGEWRQIAKGSWKPGSDGANFTRYVPFKSASAPDQVRVSYCGNGAAGLNCIALESAKTRLVPLSLLKVEGDVADPDNLLVDSYEPTMFGTPDRRASFHDPSLAEKVSSATVSLAPGGLTGPYRLEVKMDREPAIYKVGETAHATVRIFEAGRPVGGKTAVCSWNYANSNRVEIAKEGTTFDLSLDRPGQVLFRGDLYDGTNRLRGVTAANPAKESTLYVWAGALFEPEKIRMERARPADFDAYWDGEVARLKREAPLSAARVEVKEVKSGKAGFRVFDVTIPGLPPRPTCGYLVVPEGAAPKSLPALVMFQGAGSSRAAKEYHDGVMFFCINPHGVGNEVPYAEWKAYFAGDGRNYQYSGWEDREKCFFHGQALRAVRGLEWLKTRPEWNGRDLAVKGVSMGGSQSLQAAALDPDVTLCMPRDPALCDHAGFISSTRNRSGWPWILYSPRDLPALQGAHGAVDPVLLANSDYFDNVFFAPRIKCPTFLATGLGDDVCFAEGVFKMYNALGGPKDVETNPHAIHCGTFNPRAEEAFGRAVRGGSAADGGRADRLRWFTEARFGMFIHFGAYSLAARHEWVKTYEDMDDAKYDVYVRNFDPDLFDARAWVRAAKDAGMKYIVLTTKHHEGFCLFDSKYTDYKSTNTPFGRDVVKEFADACHAEGMRMGFYYSLLDWHHPHYTIDRFYPGCNDNRPVDYAALNRGRDFSVYRQYMKDQVRELLSNYGRVDVLWYDFTAFDNSSYRENFKTTADWDGAGLMALTRSLQPDVVVNDRLGSGVAGDVYTPEQVKEPKWPERNGRRVAAWETCQTFSGSWGYHRDETTWKSPRQLITMLIDTCSKGGNLILNVGPTGRGTFDRRALDRLAAIGEWMKVNGRSIYGCTEAPAEFAPPEGTVLTYNPSKRRLYVHILEYPVKVLPFKFADKVSYAQFLHDASEVQIKLPRGVSGAVRKGIGPSFHLPVLKPDVEIPVIEVFLKQ